MKLWSGRFEKDTDEAVNDFNSSLRFDQRLYKQDITGSIAHVKMLAKQNIVSAEDSALIVKTLKEILSDIEEGKIDFNVDDEDIHMFIETLLTSRIGNAGKKLHTGRSRNDQVALDLRMYVKDEIINIINSISELQEALLDISKKHTQTIMPGYTHLQRAQPVTLAHHLGAYFEMFKRDKIRLGNTYKLTDSMPLGSGALAATTYPLDREFTANELNFADITYNSLDGVSDRDYCIDFLSNLSVLMMHLSRFSEEIILWSSHEFLFIELDDAYSTGSSIMPQKKNPDVAELVRGKTGRVYGSLVGMLTMMKSLPLSYNKDMQEDKESLFDAIDTVKACLYVFTPMIKTMKIRRENMLKACRQGFINATDVADYLVGKGVSFRDAHEITGKLVRYCIENEKTLESLTLADYGKFSNLFDESVYKAISLEECVNRRNIIGGPSEEMILKVIEMNEKYLKSPVLI